MAAQLASTGVKVLLVDKASFPRGKVCGCCVSKSAVAGLRMLKLDHILAHAGAVPLEGLRLCDGDSHANLELSGGFSMSRDSFDYALVSAAMERGARFLPGHQARVLELRDDSVVVAVSSRDELIKLSAKTVVVADGLSGHALDGLPDFDVSSHKSARIGAGTVLRNAPSFYRPGTIYMCCSDNGYVGLVLLEDGKLDVACALDRDYSRDMNGPAVAAAEIIAQCKLPVPDLLVSSKWTGTDALTRKRKTVAGKRVFVIGDSCGYVEPFTGEGISWAIWSAIAAAPFVESTIGEWRDDLVRAWERVHKSSIGKRQERCEIIAAVLRRNNLRRFSISALRMAPALVSPLVRKITEEPVRSIVVPSSGNTKGKERQWTR